MASSLNRVTLIGNVGKDPEVRTTQAGARIANLTLATSESWTDKQSGERKERTEWHRIVIFNERVAEIAEKYVRKGSKIMIDGVLRTRKWTDQSGQEKYTTEICIEMFRGEILLLGDPRGADGQPTERRAPAQTQSAASGHGAASAKAGADLDDEIPF